MSESYPPAPVVPPMVPPAVPPNLPPTPRIRPDCSENATALMKMRVSKRDYHLRDPRHPDLGNLLDKARQLRPFTSSERAPLASEYQNLLPKPRSPNIQSNPPVPDLPPTPRIRPNYSKDATTLMKMRVSQGDYHFRDQQHPDLGNLLDQARQLKPFTSSERASLAPESRRNDLNPSNRLFWQLGKMPKPDNTPGPSYLVNLITAPFQDDEESEPESESGSEPVVQVLFSGKAKKKQQEKEDEKERNENPEDEIGTETAEARMRRIVWSNAVITANNAIDVARKQLATKGITDQSGELVVEAAKRVIHDLWRKGEPPTPVPEGYYTFMKAEFLAWAAEEEEKAAKKAEEEQARKAEKAAKKVRKAARRVAEEEEARKPVEEEEARKAAKAVEEEEVQKTIKAAEEKKARKMATMKAAEEAWKAAKTAANEARKAAKTAANEARKALETTEEAWISVKAAEEEEARRAVKPPGAGTTIADQVKTAAVADSPESPSSHSSLPLTQTPAPPPAPPPAPGVTTKMPGSKSPAPPPKAKAIIQTPIPPPNPGATTTTPASKSSAPALKATDNDKKGSEPKGQGPTSNNTTAVAPGQGKTPRQLRSERRRFAHKTKHIAMKNTTVPGTTSEPVIVTDQAANANDASAYAQDGLAAERAKSLEKPVIETPAPPDPGAADTLLISESPVSPTDIRSRTPRAETPALPPTIRSRTPRAETPTLPPDTHTRTPRAPLDPPNATRPRMTRSRKNPALPYHATIAQPISHSVRHPDSTGPISSGNDTSHGPSHGTHPTLRADATPFIPRQAPPVQAPPEQVPPVVFGQWLYHYPVQAPPEQVPPVVFGQWLYHYPVQYPPHVPYYPHYSPVPYHPPVQAPPEQVPHEQVPGQAPPPNPSQ
ncbi:hypothetical protein B0H66DRAFT_534731 [Apodospora peruviana]|uniref:Uncharacterized protein n=1 Tax=Apodospora peruviana TaxID=516989 RepID=A0AAE0I0X6_9PEZI|nr:hypothetical protein B0H66DRAFT_534731 [Apodospora peruviana]